MRKNRSEIKKQSQKFLRLLFVYAFIKRRQLIRVCGLFSNP